MPRLILAIDQGTTNTKALLIDQRGEPIFRTTRPVPLLTLHSGHVEQDPEALWNSVLEAINDCTQHANQLQHSIAGVAITNQRETAVAWHRTTGAPLANAVSWQCQRSADLTTQLIPHAEAIRRISGLPLSPLLSATKWAWLLQNNPQVQQATASNQLCLGTVDSWLIHKLTSSRVHATDLSNASRTALLDLKTLTWSPNLLRLFTIPANSLPQLQPSATNFGLCTAIPQLATTPIIATIGDSHAALAGHGDFRPGIVKATYGTGSSLMMLTAALAADTPALARTIAWSTPTATAYALEGNIFMTGSALQWVGEFLNLPNPSADAATLAAQVPDAGGLYLVPAMAGLGAPHWDAAARGLIANLERTHTSAHLARAAVEAIAFQVTDVFFAMQAVAALPIPSLQADGGATRNDALMQFQSDILGIPVHRSTNEELSAIGAAYLGGLTLNWWPNLEAISKLPRQTQTFHPLLVESVRTHRYAAWQSAVSRARSTKESA